MDDMVPGQGVYGVDVVVGGPKLGGSEYILDPHLFECTYGVTGSKRMAKRVQHADPPTNYWLLRRLLNPTMIAIDDFYPSAGNGYLILESVDESFTEWARTIDRGQLFIPTLSGKWKLSSLLRTMLLKVAGLIDDLIEKNCVPDGLGVQDLFIKNKIPGDRPTIKISLDFNVITIRRNADVTSALGTVGPIIDWCCQQHGVQLDDSSCSFKNYFGHHKSAQNLEKYPDGWTDEQKANYIFMILKGDQQSMSDAIVLAKVDWPWDPDPRYKPRTRAIQIVEDICYHAENLKIPTYYGYDHWSYIQLCRNLLKSFEIPPNRMSAIPNRTAVLRMMESWNPKIWTSLYEKIGPLEGDEI